MATWKRACPAVVLRMRDLSALRASYDSRASVAVRFSEWLADQIHEVIASNNLSLAVPIDTRVKTWQSFYEKIERKNIEISDAAQLGDLVGVRIILLFKRDLEQVIKLLSTILTIRSSEDAQERLGVEMFGYQSVHLQAEMRESWGQVPTLKAFVGLQAEIQIRTAAQHIWAAASHKLQYKMESSVPKQVLRSINRVAALLETVDSEFERALLDRESYVENASHSLRAGNDELVNEPLNVDIFKKILDQELPPANRTDNESYDEALEQVREIGIQTPRELAEFIRNNIEQ